MRIFSWNVNGLRAVLKKGALQLFVEKYQPDILCLQETKAKRGQAEVDLVEYEEYWNSAERAGYSGTAIFTKVTPLGVIDDLPEDLAGDAAWVDEFGDARREGRVQAMEFEGFYLVNVYVPNAKDDLGRLSYREQLWDKTLLKYLKRLEERKPVVVCGDFNVAHEEIDLARPQANVRHAGFTVEERRGMDNYVAAGLIDTFRALHPEEQKYSWWSYRGGARGRNVGWRIDYFLISESLRGALRAAEIHNEIMGSDHCPVSIDINAKV